MIELERGIHSHVEETTDSQVRDLVHIWLPRAPLNSPSLCGSYEEHLCPESENGSTIAFLDPGSTRCWCGVKVCEVCRRHWNDAVRNGTWPR